MDHRAPAADRHLAARRRDGAVQVGEGDRENAGTVTSAAMSPTHGAIALAYLHRTVAAPGGAVTVAGRRAVVHEVPLS